jgi:hypothetical protein
MTRSAFCLLVSCQNTGTYPARTDSPCLPLFSMPAMRAGEMVALNRTSSIHLDGGVRVVLGLASWGAVRLPYKSLRL